MDKKSYLKSKYLILIGLLFLLTFIVYVSSTDNFSTSLYKPVDNDWINFNDSQFHIYVQGHSVNFTFTNTSSGGIQGLNANATLYITNRSGHFARNNSYNGSDVLSRVITNITVALADNGTGYSWNILIWNGTNGTFASANRTVYKDTIYPNTSYAIGALQDFANLSYDDITLNYTSTDRNPDQCDIYTNITGDMAVANTNSSVTGCCSNETYDQYTIDNVAEGIYKWGVRCQDDAVNANWTYDMDSATLGLVNRTFRIDTTTPNLTSLSSPTNGTWWRNGSAWNWSFKLTDAAPNKCSLLTSYRNATTVFFNNLTVNQTVEAYDGFAQFELGSTNELPENDTHGYQWNVNCTDFSGNVVWFDEQNFTLYVDKTVPFNLTAIAPANDTHSTDFLPQFTWRKATEDHFEKYYLTLDDDPEFGSPDIIEEITSENSTTSGLVFHNITTRLSNDTAYFWKVNVTDEAGNWNSTMNVTDPAGKFVNRSLKYTQDSTCATLIIGWSACGVIRNWGAEEAPGINNSFHPTRLNLSLELIGRETGADYVSFWNASHAWQTHTVGTSTNDWINLSFGDTVWIYTDAVVEWPHRVWGNMSSGRLRQNQTYDTVNLTNTTNSAWNFFAVTNTTGLDFGELEVNLNTSSGAGTGNFTGEGNFTYFAFYNNTDLNSIPYIWDFGINNDTTIDFGEVIAMFFEGANGVEWNFSNYTRRQHWI